MRNTSDTKRAPIPWRIVEWTARDNDGAIDGCGFQIVDADGFLVSTSTLEDEDEETLLLIVRACNSHEKLVAALKQALEAGEEGDWQTARRVINGALAAAEAA